VKSGHVTDTLTLQSPDPGTFKAKDDGHGGTKIVLVVPHAKPMADAAPDHSDADDTATMRASDGFQFKLLAASGLHGGNAIDLHLGLASFGTGDFRFAAMHQTAADAHSHGDLHHAAGEHHAAPGAVEMDFAIGMPTGLAHYADLLF
jgi:hypothetical protein